MATCPVCSNELTEDFGLVECPQCGSPVLLSVEGAAEAAPEVAEEAPEPTTEEPVMEFAEAPAETPENFSINVEDFVAEKPGSTALESGFKYNLVIKGIDTAEIRRNVRDTISDMRFRLDVDRLLNSVHHGEVRIQNLTPIKAALLVQRLRVLPVELSWDQERV